MVLFKKGVTIQNGNISIPLSSANDYFITTSLIEEGKSEVGLVPIAIFGGGLCLFIISVVILVTNLKKWKNAPKEEDLSDTQRIVVGEKPPVPEKNDPANIETI